jgi:uncharacterized integral membrane protein
LLSTLGTILKWAILLPIFLAVVLLALANDHSITVNLNPFDKTDAALKFEFPLYQFAFLIFVLGVLFGGLIAWAGQRRRVLQSRRSAAASLPARADQPNEQKSQAEALGASAFLPRPERG